MKKVKVTFPDGSTADLDEADVPAALSAGAKRDSGATEKSTSVVFPDGSIANISEDHVADALKAGAVKKKIGTDGTSEDQNTSSPNVTIPSAPATSQSTLPINGSTQQPTALPFDPTQFLSADQTNNVVKPAPADADPIDALADYHAQRTSQINNQKNILRSNIINTNQDESVRRGDMPQPNLHLAKPLVPETKQPTAIDEAYTKINEANDYQKKLDAAIRHKASIAAGEKTQDAAVAGRLVRKALGDKTAIDEQHYADKGYPIAPEKQYYNEVNGIDALNTALDEKYKDAKDDTNYIAQKLLLQQQSQTLLDKHPEYKQQQISKAIAQQLLKDHPNTVPMGLLRYAPDAAKKLGFSEADLKDIDYDNLPIQGALSSAVGEVYNTILKIGAGIARPLGSLVGVDKDYLNANITDALAKGQEKFADVSTTQSAPTVVDTNPKSATYLQDVANTEKGKYNYNFHTISNAIGGGVGNLVGIVAGTKGLGNVAKAIVPTLGEAAAVDAGMAGTMVLQGYEPYYQKSREVIGDDPKDEWKRHAYSLINGSLDYAVFKPLGKLQEAINPAAAKELGAIFKDAPSLDAVNKEVLTNWTTKVLQGAENTVGETAKIGGAQVLGEVSKNIIDNVVGTKDAADKSNKELGGNIISGIESLPFSMMIPLGMGEVAKGVKSSYVFKENLYNAGLHPDTYLGQANDLLHKNVITQEQYDKRAQVINTASSIVRSIPDDVDLNHNQKVAYVNSRLRQAALQAKAEGISDESLDAHYKKQIDEEVKNRTNIINGAEKTNPFVAPEETAPTLDSVEKARQAELESSDVLMYGYYTNKLKSPDLVDWQVKQAQEYLDNPIKTVEKNIEISKRNLRNDPNNKISLSALKDNEAQLPILKEIYSKYDKQLSELNKNENQKSSDTQVAQGQTAENGQSGENVSGQQVSGEAQTQGTVETKPVLSDVEKRLAGSSKISGFKKAVPKVDQSTPTASVETKTAQSTENPQPISQLGTGANVYYKEDKYIVNDSKDGKVLLNINDNTDTPFPVANIEFDNTKEAVQVAERLHEIYPNGVPPALEVEKAVENIKKDLSIPETPLPPVEQKIKDTKPNAPNEAKKLYKEIAGADHPQDARGLALGYIAGGGKISETSVNDIAGTVKRATLNTGRKEVKSKEVRARDYITKDAPTIKGAAHSLWDNLPEDLQHQVPVTQIENELNDIVNSHNRRLSAANEFKDRYILKEVVKDLSDEDIKQIEDAQIHNLTRQAGELDPAIKEDVHNVLSKYQDQYGNVRWDELKADNDGFEPLLLQLPKEVQNKIDELINNNTREKTSKFSYANPKDNSGKAGEGESVTQEVKTALSAYEKAKRNLKDAEDRIAKKQGTQTGLFGGGVQKELFGVGRDEAKDILDPLRNTVKETKASLDKAQSKLFSSGGNLSLFSVRDKPNSELEQNASAIKEYMDSGISDLKDIQDSMARVTGDNSEELRQQVKDAFDYYHERYIPKEVHTGVVDRIKQTFGKLLDKGVHVYEDAKELLKAAAGYERPQMQVDDIYHGSPHSFDKFSSDRVGTGQGAASFGHGLYFTDIKAIAEKYAKDLGDLELSHLSLGTLRMFDRGNYSDYSSLTNEAQRSLAERILIEEPTIREAWDKGGEDAAKKVIKDVANDYVKLLEEDLKRNPKDAKYYDGMVKEAKRMAAREPAIKFKGNRHLYKVSLHEGKTPDQYDWLHWDKKPTSVQMGKIEKQLNEEGFNVRKETPYGETTLILDGVERMGGNNYDITFKEGRKTYDRLSVLLGGDKEASDFLLRAGIDGVKYPADSLGGGTTSDNAKGFNYVVFDDKAVTIKDRLQFQYANVPNRVKADDIINHQTESFYSPLEKFIEGNKQNSFTGEQVLGQIKNLPQTEIEWIGLKDFLKDKQKVTKQELLDYVRENKVNVEVIEKSDNVFNKEADRLKKLHDKAVRVQTEIADKLKSSSKLYVSGKSYTWHYKDLYKAIEVPQEYQEKLSKAEEDIQAYNNYIDDEDAMGAPVNANTKYSQYTLPGEKSNYREVLLTLPQPKIDNEFEVKHDGDFWTAYNKTTDDVEFEDKNKGEVEKYIAQTTKNLSGLKTEKVKFQSSHFDEHNIIAHIRLTDRTTPDGKRILFVEESQSDWQRSIRQKGAANLTELPEGYRIESPTKFQNWSVVEPTGIDGNVQSTTIGLGDTKEIAVQRALDNLNRRRTPDMPFKNDKWVELATKKAIQIASQEGYDGIAWINGEQTKDRYDLSKHIDEVSYSVNKDGTYKFAANRDSEAILTNDKATLSDIENSLGKEIAERIKNGVGESYDYQGVPTKSLTDVNLKVGGKWAENLYDKQIPKLAEKYAKQYGGKVGEFNVTGISDVKVTPNTHLNGKTTYTATWVENGKEQSFNYYSEKELNAFLKNAIPADVKQFGIEITPDMKAKTESLPLFMKNPKGEALGFTAPDGSVHLNGEKLNGNTPVHEAGHLWLNWAKDNRPQLHEKGMALTENSKYLKDVKANKNYVKQADAEKLTGQAREDFFRNEALATAIGDKGEQFISQSRKTNFKDWLTDLWNNVKEHFGIRDLSGKQISELTLDEFSKKAAADILSGKQLETGKPRIRVDVTPKSENTSPPTEDKGKVTGVKKAITEEVRTERNLPKVELPKTGKDVDNLQAAKERIDSGTVNPRELVDRILEGKSGYGTKDEVWDMHYYAHQLEAHEQSLRSQLAEATDDIGKAGITGQLQQLSDEVDRQTEAAQVAGRTWSAVGQSMQPVIDMGFNPSREKSFIKDAYGGEVPKDVQEKMDAAFKERDAAIAEKNRLELELAKAKAERAIKPKTEKVAGTKKKTHEEFVKERQSYVEELKAAKEKHEKWIKDNGIQMSGVGFTLTGDMLKAIGKIVKSHVSEQVGNAEEIASKVHEQIKDIFPGIAKKDVLDIMAGKYNKSAERTDLTKQVADIRRQAKKISDANLTKDELTQKEVKRLNRKADEIERNIKEGRLARPEIVYEKNNDLVKATQRVANAEFKIRMMKRKAFESKKSLFQKGLMWAGRLTRLSILSGYNVLYKLAAAATIGAGLKRVPEQAIGKVWSTAFKGIAEKAPIEGFLNAKSEALFYKEFFDPKKFVHNSWEILKTGSSDLTKRLDFTAGQYEHVPVLYLPTDLHQIIKDPVKRATFESSFRNGLIHAEKNGLDIHDPLVIQSLQTAAYKRANYEIFQEQNWLSRKLTSYKSSLEKKGDVGAAAKFLIDFMVPVSTVPTNIVRRIVTTSPLGLIRGSLQVREAYRNGLSELSNEQADKIMMQLKQGSLGTGLWLAGWFGAASLGGLYSSFNPDKKRKSGQLKHDEMQVGDVMLPKPVQHALPLEIMQIAATSRHIYENYTKHKNSSDVDAIYHAGLGSIGALLEQIPVVETAAHVIGAFGDPYEAKQLEKDIKRRFEPQILRETGVIPKDKK